MRLAALAGSLAVALVGGAAQAQAVHGARVEALLGLEMRSAGSGIKQDSRPVFGVRAGYDLKVANRFSLGIDAEVSGFAHDGDDRQSVPNFNPPNGPFVAIPAPPTYTDFVYRTRSQRNLYFGGRASYAVSNAIGVFSAVGYSNQRATACGFLASAGTCTNVPAVIRPGLPVPGPIPVGATATSATRDLGGVRFGGGVTVELTRHLFTTVEYRHTSYGSADIARLHVGLLTYAPKFGRTDQVAGAIGWRF